MNVGILLTVVVPHAPILIGARARASHSEVRRVVEAVERVTWRIARVNPETVIIATPHAPLSPDAFGLHVGDVVKGSFAHHGRAALVVRFESDLELVDEIVSHVFDHGMRIFEIPEGTPLDHGALVPLYFLQQAGWRGRVIVVGGSYLSDHDHLRYGKCIERAARALGRRAVFIGSANLSHRLSAEAPYGYHARAHEFDAGVVSSLAEGEFARLLTVSPELRALAIECAYRPLLIAVGAAGEHAVRHEVLSYESVSGVGCVVAVLADRSCESEAST